MTHTKHVFCFVFGFFLKIKTIFFQSGLYLATWWLILKSELFIIGIDSICLCGCHCDTGIYRFDIEVTENMQHYPLKKINIVI